MCIDYCYAIQLYIKVEFDTYNANIDRFVQYYKSPNSSVLYLTESYESCQLNFCRFEHSLTLATHHSKIEMN